MGWVGAIVLTIAVLVIIRIIYGAKKLINSLPSGGCYTVTNNVKACTASTEQQCQTNHGVYYKTMNECKKTNNLNF